MGKSNKVVKYSELDYQKKIQMEETVLNKTISNKISDKNVFMIENIPGFTKKIINDGDKTYVIQTNDSIKDKVFLDLFNKKYNKKFINVINEFENVPFIVWARMINNDIVFYDLKINSNWVDYDMLTEIFNKFKLNTLPIVYSGKYDESILKERLKVKSIYNGDDIKSIYIRSTLEDSVDKVRFNFFTNENSFSNRLEKKSEIWKDIEKKVNLLIESKTKHPDYTINKWKTMLIRNGLVLGVSKRSEIYRTIVYASINEWAFDIYNIANTLNVDKEDVNKKIKSSLPRVIRKMMME